MLKYLVLRSTAGHAPEEVARFESLHDASEFAAGCVDHRSSRKVFASESAPRFVVLGPGNYRRVYETPAVSEEGKASDGDSAATHRAPTGLSPEQIVAAYCVLRRELKKKSEKNPRGTVESFAKHVIRPA